MTRGKLAWYAAIPRMSLPVLVIADSIVAALRTSNRLVLCAPTGSGKTTQVPQIIFRSGIVHERQQIIVLQPRRLATRLVAARVAHEMNSKLGETIGYRTKHDFAESSSTRIRFVTEGLMLRLLQSDPQLSGVGCVILDEFHERSLPADISLALLYRLQRTARPDLKLIVMSATLDSRAVADYLKCEALETSGRLHPVDIHYLSKPPSTLTEPPWDLAARALRQALTTMPHGDVLIFMPGGYEISRTIEACERAVAGWHQPIRFCPLHGSLPPSQQDVAVSSWPGGRKVIVATNVAETSITIDGVTVVIDSGLARVHRFDAKRGLNSLRIEPISRASADQRAGRAGRTAPGLCLRLWTARDHGQRAERDVPEVHRLELSEAILTLKAMGHEQIEAPYFDWFTPPLVESVARAQSLLRVLEAIDEHDSLTPLGRTMAEFPTHPRIARVLMDGARRGCVRRAITWASLINERDVFPQPQRHILLRFVENGEPPSDIAAIERAYEELEACGFDARRCAAVGANIGACREVQRTITQFASVCRRLRMPMQGSNRTSDLIASLLTAFRDHLAMKLDRERPNCTMPDRRKVMLDRESVVKDAGLIIALDIREIGRGDGSHTMLSLASHLDPSVLQAADPDGIEAQHKLRWNAEHNAVECVEGLAYRGLVLEETVRAPTKPTDVHGAASMIVERIVSGELKLDQWNDRVEQWIARARCVAKWFPEKSLIAYDDEDVRVILHEIVGNASRFSKVRDRPCLDLVRNAIDWDQQQFIERMAPESILLPHGRRMNIEYFVDGPPKARAKIQDLYDLEDTPRVAAGRQALLLEILGPNFRPVQLTSDLRGFWQKLYPELKKELKRRYPRHEWR